MLLLGAGARGRRRHRHPVPHSAVDYYCNVDEVGRDGCDDRTADPSAGHRRRRLRRARPAITAFTITFNDATIPVRYDGEPGGIFKECIPVVVHGVIETHVARATGSR